MALEGTGPLVLIQNFLQRHGCLGLRQLSCYIGPAQLAVDLWNFLFHLGRHAFHSLWWEVALLTGSCRCYALCRGKMAIY